MVVCAKEHCLSEGSNFSRLPLNIVPSFFTLMSPQKSDSEEKVPSCSIKFGKDKQCGNTTWSYGIRKDTVFEPHSQHTASWSRFDDYAPSNSIFWNLTIQISLMTLIDVGYVCMQYKQRLARKTTLDSIQAFTVFHSHFTVAWSRWDVLKLVFFGSSPRSTSLLSLEYEMRLKYFRVFLTVLNPQINQFGLHRASKILDFACPQIMWLLSALHIIRSTCDAKLQLSFALEKLRDQVY